jgi:hypothetical protein
MRSIFAQETAKSEASIGSQGSPTKQLTRRRIEVTLHLIGSHTQTLKPQLRDSAAIDRR